MTGKPRPIPIFPAGLSIGGVGIVGLVEDHVASDLRRYAVTYQCCGVATTMTQRQILQRQAKGITRCHACGVKREAGVRQGGLVFTPYALGTVVGGARVEAVLVEGATVSRQVYAVTYQCCGARDERTHDALSHRELHGSRYCAHCCKKAGGKTLSERAERARGPVVTSFRLIDEMPARMQPKPKIHASDIERHLARVFKVPRADGCTSTLGFHHCTNEVQS